jgi:TonB family protein
MKITPKLMLLLLAPAAGLVTQAFAAFEPLKLTPDNPMPLFPPALVAEGITRGRVVMAISVSAEGKLNDSLVVAYTQRALALACMDVIKHWQFIPARLDGDPVPLQTELTFNFTVEGAVISANIVNHYLFDKFDDLAEGELLYRPRLSRELDRPLTTPAGAAAPKYATEAENQGIRGKVVVHFYVDETGAVRMPAAQRDGAHPYLMETAVEAVRAWKFEPPTSNGSPALIVAEQEFDFGSRR